MKRLLALLFSLALFSTSPAVVWEAVPNPGDTFDNIEMFLSGEDKLYAAGFTSRVYASEDHGDTWTEIAGGIESEYASVWSLHILNDWFFMSQDGHGGHNFRSHRVGGEWQPWESLPHQDGPINHLCSIGSSLFGVFYGGGLHRSDDYGLSWTPLDVTGAESIWNIFVEEGRLFASGNEINGGSIWRSDDLGASWVEVGAPLNSSYLCSEIYWQDQLLVCVYNMGGNGTFYSSTDFGDSWTVITTLPTDDNINGMAIADDGRLAIGDSSGYGGESIWLSADLVNWENWNGNLGSYAGAFNTLHSHDGWFFKTGGVQSAMRAAQPEATAAEQAPLVAGELAAWPNPFNPKTTLRFALEAAGPVELAIFDLTGRRVAEVFRGELGAGSHEFPWNAEGLASGVYLARFSTDESWSAKKLVLMK